MIKGTNFNKLCLKYKSTIIGIMRLFLSILIVFISSNLYPQSHDSKVGISFGTTLGTYAGADFGSTYYMSFYTNDYYNDNYYNNSYYNDGYNSSFLSPLEFDLGIDIRVSNNLSLSFESSYIWHFNGKPNRDYVTKITGNGSYLEMWDNANMYAVPMFLSLKLYPLGRENYSFYISGGYGMQYISESMDRVREDLDYNNYYGSYRYYVGGVSDAKWMQGVKLAIGMNFNMGYAISNETEIKVTNFFPQRSQYSQLAMNTTTNITFIGLTTKMYFNF